MVLETFVSQYGYAAVIVGTFFEGETILILGAFMASRGYLDLAGVIAAGCAGTIAGDQTWYWIGRRHGAACLDRRSGWRARAGRITRLLHRHDIGLILLFRFLYGLRTLTPILLGASGVRPRRFTVFEALGAVVWTVAVAGAGHLMGQAVTGLLKEAEHVEEAVFAVIVLLAVGVGLLNRHTRQRRAAQPAP